MDGSEGGEGGGERMAGGLWVCVQEAGEAGSASGGLVLPLCPRNIDVQY